MFLNFDDYIKTYEDYADNKSEWIDIFCKYKNKDKDKEEDFFIMAAMTKNNEKNIGKCLKEFSWGYNPDSFGKATFYKYLGDDKKIEFSPGNIYKNFDEEYEYLVAFRRFNGDYKYELDINPMLKWYGNLAETKDGFIDTISNEIKIRKSEGKVSILREYLKDFLAAYNKVCVIGYDNRRYINTNDEIKKDYITKKDDLFNYSLVIDRDTFSDYKYFSCILGKIIIKPYLEPLHEDYLYLKPKKEEFTEYIIATDQQSGKEITFTCDESKLANYFGANQGSPHFLTPVYFTRDVLDRYTSNPAQYTVEDDHIAFFNIWSLPYTRNNEDRVIVWLGDLGRIPFKEQQYWRVFNVAPYGYINDKFLKRQLEAEWTESIGEEKKLFSLINKINKHTKDAFGEMLFKELSEGDSQLQSAFIVPSNNSITQYQAFLMQLNKLTVERVNSKCIETKVDKEKLINPDNKKKYGSRIQLSMFLKELNISNENECDKTFKLVSDSRNKIAGHSASISQYNKLWGRKEDTPINFINDSKELLSRVNKCLTILENELNNGK